MATRIADRIEMWPPAKLIPFERNPRTHSDEQVDQIAASIIRFGFTSAILVDSAAGILAGHGRLLAALKLGMPLVPVVVLDYLTEAEKKAYVIADNKLALNAGWDEDLLHGLLDELKDDGFDLNVVGFSQEELDEILRDPDEPVAGQTDEDAVPEVPVIPVSARGDVWILGGHVVCPHCHAKNEL